MRKFLAGQTMQIILSSEVMHRLDLSTRRIFDDLYLFIRNQSSKLEANEVHMMA